MEQFYRRYQIKHQRVPTFEEVKVAFGESLCAFREIYTLIDGLDKLANLLEPFLDLLGVLIRPFENLKILTTSTPARSLMRHRLYISREPNSGQLRHLLANGNLWQEVEENIFEKADGMYCTYDNGVCDRKEQPPNSSTGTNMRDWRQTNSKKYIPDPLYWIF